MAAEYKGKRGKKAAEPPKFDRTPPQSVEAERSVLGAMLINPDAVGTAIEVLRDEGEAVFYVPAHQIIYDVLVKLTRKNLPADATTLVDSLMREEKLEDVGGAGYIAELIGAQPTSANVEFYARLVLEASLLRRIITACSNISSEAYQSTEEVGQLLDRAEQEIFSIAQQRQANPIATVRELLDPAIERIENQMKSHGVTGLATGFHKLDEMLSGLQPSDMIVLAARPSVGKTAFCLNMASHAANRLGKGVLIFSLEMAKEQLVTRLLCMEGMVDSERLRSGFLARAEFPKIIKAADVLQNSPIYIDDTPSISVLEMRSKARRHNSKHSIDLIIVDYLQLMTTGVRGENRQVEIAEISRSMKGLARELRVPVVALAQLNREAEKDDSGVPKLSHLRESGAIEQDADVIMMLARQAMHKRRGNEDDDAEEPNENIITLAVAKQRNGPTGIVKLFFDKPTQRFRDLVEGTAVPAPFEGAPEPDDVYVEEEFEEDDVPF